MSMLTHVFFAGSMPTPIAVTETMQRLGLNFAISDDQEGLDAYDGMMPMTFRVGADTHGAGVEVYVGSARETIDEFDIEGIDPKLDKEIVFCFSESTGAACALALAAAIATLTGGIIFDESEEDIVSIETAVEECREEFIPAMLQGR